MNASAQAILKTIEGDSVPLRGVSAEGHVRGLLFELSIEQQYENTTDRNIETVFTFPLPDRAVLLGLEVTIGERVLAAQAVRTDTARRRYEDAIEAGDTAALLERAGDGLYTVSLGNLLAGERALVRYRYAEQLDVRQDGVRLSVPTVIAPRYGDASAHVEAPHQVPETRLTAEYPFSLSITVEGPLATGQLSSPTHRISNVTDEEVARVTLAEDAWLDRDFVLLAQAEGFRGASLVATDTAGGEAGYVAQVSWVPQLPNPAPMPWALKVLIDCSGSMGGDSIAQARRALSSIIAQVNEDDLIGLTRFGSTVVPVTDGLQAPNDVLLSELKRVALEMNADLGGTRLPAALTYVLAQPTRGADHPAVLLVTDGEIWAVTEALDAVRAAQHRLFVVAVGSAPAEPLARQIAEATGGACEFVTPGEDIEGAIVRMARRMREPVYAVADVAWPATPKWITPLPSAVFAGDTVNLMAGFDAVPEGSVEIRVSGAEPETVALAQTVSEEPTLARVAAAHRLATLSDEEAAALAEHYQLASRFTAFVMVMGRTENERPKNLPILRSVDHMLAAGWGGLSSVDTSVSRMDVSRASMHIDAALFEAPEHFDASFDDSMEFGSQMPLMADDVPTSANGVLTPFEVVGRLLEQLRSGSRRPAQYADLRSLGVPEPVVAGIVLAAGSERVGESDAVMLWTALLIERLEPDAMVESALRPFRAILGDRRLRSLRLKLRRLAAPVSSTEWESRLAAEVRDGR